MTIKIGINGFGRIGRMVFRAAIQNFHDIEVVGINDLLEPDYLAYMLKFDSVHGRFQGEVSVDNGHLVVNGKKIRLTQERDPAALKWNEIGADVVVEATGLFLDQATAEKHLAAGAKKVLLSAPSKDDTPMFVYGVNHATYKGEAIISNASCTTTDFRGETCTSMFDADASVALDGTFVKLVSWYDNEWGYSNKCLEMVRVIAK